MFFYPNPRTGIKQVTNKAYDESEMRTRQKLRIVTTGDP